MRWRLYIVVLSAILAFCFILLTAVTDPGDRQTHRPPVLSMPRPSEAPVPLSAALPLPPPMRIGNNAADSIIDVIPTAPVIAKHLALPTPSGSANKKQLLQWDKDNGWYKEEFALVTAYCPCTRCCGPYARGITATGSSAWTEGVAAEPARVGYGTRVYVPGYGMSVVDDTGGAMRRNWRRNGLLHLDVRMPYHYEARQWGNQYLQIRIYDEF